MEYKLYKTMDEIKEQGKGMDKVKEDLYQLWQECFGDSVAYTDFYFDWKVKENQVLTIYKENNISAMLHLNPYQVVMKEKIIPANYIVGVATRQQDRRQGLMKRLLEESLWGMYEEKMPFTYLMPAAEAIYSPFDFRIVYELVPWNQFLYETYNQMINNNLLDSKNMETQILSHMNQELRVVVLEEDREGVIEDLVHFSNGQLAKHYDVYVKRNPYYFKRLLHEMKATMGNVLVIYNEQQIVGYLAYMAEDSVYITEAIYHEDWKETIFKTILLEDKVIHKVIKQGGLKNHKAPTIMARIIHLETFLQDLTAKEDFSLTLQVKDPILSNNNGCFQLHFTNMGCKVARTEGLSDLNITIADLTKLCFGKINGNEFYDFIVGNDKETMIKKLKCINCYHKVFINDVV